MSFIKSEQHVEITVLRCLVCKQTAAYDDLMNYGARCFPCFENYCKDVPYTKVERNIDKDDKFWAKQIIKKHQAGETVRSTTLKIAQIALKKEKNT